MVAYERLKDDETLVTVPGDKLDVGKAGDAKKQPPSPAMILAVVAFYWVSSLSVVFLNKMILSSSEYRFPYPFLVTWYQLLVALVLLVVCGELGKSVALFSLIPPFEFRTELVRKILPLSTVYVLMLALNNFCLNYVEVTYYQVARSLTILFNIVLGYVYAGTRTSTPALLCCLVVFIGFAVGSYGEISFSWIGLFSGIGSSFFVAMYGILVKSSLVIVDNNQWRLLHYNTALALIIMVPLIMVSGEFTEARKYVGFFDQAAFWYAMTGTGVTGFLINIAVFLQIKYTTPLANTISGTAKACVQTILAWFVWQNVITSMNGFGILLSLAGSGMFSYVRYLEMKR